MALAAAVSEVPRSAEEPGEEVEGVVVLLGAAAALLVLLYAVVAVLVVDAAGFFVGEDFVGFGYGDEFVVGCVVASGGGLVWDNCRSTGSRKRLVGGG